MKKKVLSLLIIGTLATGISGVMTSNVFAAGNLDNASKSMVLLAKNDSLQDGKYSVGIKILKEKSDDLSMAGQYIGQTAKINVENGKMYLSVDVTRIDWMKNISVFLNGSSVNYDLKKASDNKNATVKFQIPNTKPDIKFGMNVEPMGNARVAFRVVLNDNITKLAGSTVKNNNDNDNKATSSSLAKATKSKGELPKTGSPISQSSLLWLGGLTTVLGGVLLKKKN